MGVENGDTEADMEWLAAKAAGLRLSEIAGRPVHKGVFGADMQCAVLKTMDHPMTFHGGTNILN